MLGQRLSALTLGVGCRPVPSCWRVAPDVALVTPIAAATITAQVAVPEVTASLLRRRRTPAAIRSNGNPSLSGAPRWSNWRTRCSVSLTADLRLIQHLEQ
jgi:hypothetical protein